MPKAHVNVPMTVNHRSRWGQFEAHYKNAGTQTVKDAIDEGAKLSRTLAPVGPKADMRTVPLKASIFTEMVSRTMGRWYSIARHAAAVEYGGRPHPITANVRFFWEREGRMWEPGDGFINHPGNPSQPFMRPAYDIIKGRLSRIARQNYRT